MRIRRSVGVAALAATLVTGWAMPAHAQGTAGKIEVMSYGGIISITGSADTSMVVVRGTLIASTLPIKLTNPGQGECVNYGLVGAFGYVADCSKAVNFAMIWISMGNGTDIVDVQESLARVEVYGGGDTDMLTASSNGEIYLGGDGGNDTLTLNGGSWYGSNHTARGASGADTFYVRNNWVDDVYCGVGDGATDTVHRDPGDRLSSCKNDLVY